MGDQNPASGPSPFQHPLMGMLFNQGNQAAGVEPPRHWLQESVQLHNGKRTTRVTVPSTFVDHAGVDKEDLPEVDCYFDPSNGLAILDLENHFAEGDR